MTVSKANQEAKERYWKKKYDEAPEVECACGCGEKMKSVDRYGRKKTYLTGHNNRKYDHADTYAHKKAWVKRHRDWANNRRKTIARSRKIEIIRMLGGKCDKCGYEYNGTNGPAFELHHTGEFEKIFTIGGELSNKSWADLRSEVDKCQILCANCHNIHHIGEY